jgi:hypothetical protein
MPLRGGDCWRGLDTLAVVDESTGETIVSGCILTDMDIDPHENLVTMFVSSDISYD